MILEPQPRLLDAASDFLAASPTGYLSTSRECVSAFEPELTVALDFLFWFSVRDTQGTVGSSVYLDEALAWLSTVSGVIVIGAIPTELEYKQLERLLGSVPSAEEIDAANGRIRQWAARHPRVLLLDPDLVFRRLREEGLDREDLLQADGLHPTMMMTVTLLAATLEKLIAESPLGISPELRTAVGQRGTSAITSWSQDVMSGALELKPAILACR